MHACGGTRNRRQEGDVLIVSVLLASRSSESCSRHAAASNTQTSLNGAVQLERWPVKQGQESESYEDATNTVLREAVANNLPDVTMQGLNRQQTLVEKGIAQSLEPFIAAEADFEKEGYHQAMLSLSTFDEDVYGLPFSISLPVGYYNMDLLREGGITALPTNWDEVIAACKTMKSNGIDNPIFWGWNITGNWFMQALLWSQDKAIVEDGRVTMDSPEALVALEQMQEIFTECEMQNLEWKAALSSFSAGDIGMMFWSTSALGAVERSQGDFELVTGPFPGLDNAPLGLPAGGNAAMLTSTSEDPAVREAAWTWLKYITSGEGAAEVAKTTGYMPPNKAANEIILADFYEQNPNKQTAVDQLYKKLLHTSQKLCVSRSRWRGYRYPVSLL